MNDLAIVIIIGIVVVGLVYVIINQMMASNATNKRLMYIIEGVLPILPSKQGMSTEDEIDGAEGNEDFDPHNIEVE